jgi:Lyzozyme M1 (1,4-beta-N-acetylmuramidase)
MIYFAIGGPILAYVNYFNTLLYQAVHWSFLQNNWFRFPFLFLMTSAITLIPSQLSDRFCPTLNGRIRLPQGVVRKYPKTCIAVCASVVILGAGIFIAVAEGIVIPNRIYARHYPVRGVDVSSCQSRTDWRLYQAKGIRFAFIKATEGSGQVDPCFRDHWRSVSETDIKAGAYHRFSFESTGKAQAEHFISTVPVVSDALPPVVEIVYYGSYERHPLSAEKIVPELRDLLEALEMHYGKRPMIHVTEPVYLQYVYSHFDDYDIWFCNTLTDPPEGNWRFWQYTDRERLIGYDGKDRFIDMNVFLGSEEEWNRFIMSD